MVPDLIGVIGTKREFFLKYSVLLYVGVIVREIRRNSNIAAQSKFSDLDGKVAKCRQKNVESKMSTKKRRKAKRRQEKMSI